MLRHAGVDFGGMRTPPGVLDDYIQTVARAPLVRAWVEAGRQTGSDGVRRNGNLAGGVHVKYKQLGTSDLQVSELALGLF